MRSRHDDRHPASRGPYDSPPNYDHDYDRWPYTEPARRRYRRLGRSAPRRPAHYRHIAFDAGEPGPPRGGPRRQQFRESIDRFRERARSRWQSAEDESNTLLGRSRRIARRYKEPIIGAAIVGASLPLAVGEGTAMEPDEQTIREQRLPGHPVARRTIEEDVGKRMASLRAADIRESTIEGATLVYNISRSLAEQIYDAAVANDIEPELAFGLVKTESAFDHRAVSHVGARGLTQVMPRTARWLRPGTTIEDLYDRELNLNLGFGYLRDLIDKYDGDVRLALLAYNRGPGTVDRVLARGGNPDNGYADLVLEGYTDLA